MDPSLLPAHPEPVHFRSTKPLYLDPVNKTYRIDADLGHLGLEPTLPSAVHLAKPQDRSLSRTKSCTEIPLDDTAPSTSSTTTPASSGPNHTSASPASTWHDDQDDLDAEPPAKPSRGCFFSSLDHLLASASPATCRVGGSELEKGGAQGMASRAGHVRSLKEGRDSLDICVREQRELWFGNLYHVRARSGVVARGGGAALGPGMLGAGVGCVVM